MDKKDVFEIKYYGGSEAPQMHIVIDFNDPAIKEYATIDNKRKYLLSVANKVADYAESSDIDYYLQHRGNGQLTSEKWKEVERKLLEKRDPVLFSSISRLEAEIKIHESRLKNARKQLEKREPLRDLLKANEK